MNTEAINAELKGMSARLEAYCKAQGLPYLCAEELRYEEGVTDEHRAWLDKFGEEWDATVAMYPPLTEAEIAHSTVKQSTREAV